MKLQTSINHSEKAKIRLLTIKEAAELVDGLTEYRIRQMCKSGQLPCFKAGRKYLINAEALYRVVFEEAGEIFLINFKKNLTFNALKYKINTEKKTQLNMLAHKKLSLD